VRVSLRARALSASALLAFVAPLAAPAQSRGTAPAAFTLEQVKSYPFPNELTAARTGSRIAWAFNERGARNVWVAEGPQFAARRLTAYPSDDGQELTSVSISPDGRHVVYVRGGEHGSNWEVTVPVNPTSSPAGQRVQIWTVPFEGGTPKTLGEGDSPAISPRGDLVAFERDRQIWVAPVDCSSPAR
jgi:Tol biopolymer transport system component